MRPKLNLLFLCTGNSCRSQMAEGLANALRGQSIKAYSAGTAPQMLNPKAVLVMQELGIDISGHTTKEVAALGDITFDYVITLCGDAREQCPVWQGRAKVRHRGFDDPPKLTEHSASEEEALSCYRRVRDEIKNFIETLPKCLESELAFQE